MASRSDRSAADLVATSVRLGALENDFGELSDRFTALENKVESGMGSLAREFRSSLSALTTQIGERNRTPWGVIFAGAAVAATMVGMIGSQALSPIQSDLTKLKGEMVPRVEQEYRQKVAEDRYLRLETWLTRIDADHDREMTETIKRLRSEPRHD
jgi:hypothetical protein